VPASTPDRLRLSGHCLIVLERTLLAAAPEEGCALLLGTQQHRTLMLQWIWPCLNQWQPAAERTRRFQLDPREQLLAQRWSRKRGLTVLGAAHSHPCSAAVPSATDLELCLGPMLMLIRTGRAEGMEALGAWWIPDSTANRAPAQALTIELHDAAHGPGDLGE
jgi:[CysO sulfur-carrier protein]-S-L-cysteine hydrolase